MNAMPDLFPVTADSNLVERAAEIFSALDTLPLPERIETLNALKIALRKYSPFKGEPVDCVVWVPSDAVTANDYNPNSVAPPEMKLLERSIQADGYTQPIVSWHRDDVYEVVDGFHRHRVGKESAPVRERVMGYLPLVVINQSRTDKSDRIAATIRHNRARGKHRVEAMSDIVIELKRRNWSADKIGRELGMEPDEVLRLCQITGLEEVFKDQEFSKGWEVAYTDGPDSNEEILSDVIDEFKPKDDGRILHTWDKWECYRAGFYAEAPPDGMTQEQGEEIYRAFLADSEQFESALRHVTTEWKHSCEHYLTNDRMNRIAWLGQASVAYAHHVPCCCRGGYHRLTDEQKKIADALALKYLNIWLANNGRPEVTPKQASGRTEMELY